MPSYNQDRVDALRGVILPWIRTVSKQDIIDETMSSTLIGKKLKVDWDKVPKTFRKRRIISDDKERGFWKKKRELPK